MLQGSKIQVMCAASERYAEACACASALDVTLNGEIANALYQLNFEQTETHLVPLDRKAHGAIRVDFTTGKNDHRRRFGGGKTQLIAKACGVKDKVRPSIIDATAGFGQDAFVLASLGCPVTLLERSPAVYALLEDGLRRARASAVDDASLSAIFARMRLHHCEGIAYLRQPHTPAADVVYLDPMFPEKATSAAVNKNMQALQTLLGADFDEQALLQAALTKAFYRVVVKRPRLAPTVAGVAPSFQLLGKSTRFDIYTLRAIPKA